MTPLVPLLVLLHAFALVPPTLADGPETPVLLTVEATEWASGPDGYASEVEEEEAIWAALTGYSVRESPAARRRELHRIPASAAPRTRPPRR